MIPNFFKRFSQKIERIPLYERLYLWRELKKKRLMHRFIKSIDPIILDIGAYNGQDTLDFLELFPKARIYSFEPDPRLIENLRENLKDPRVTIISKAMSDKEGHADFFLSSSKSCCGGSSSLKKPKEHLEIFPWISFEEKTTIETTSLDLWTKNMGLERLDIVWADVQGAEKELIRGGEQTLNEKTRLFCTECYNNQMYQNQIGPDDIMKMLPNFTIVRKYSHEIIFQNRKLIAI